MPLDSPNQRCGFLPQANVPSTAKCAVQAGAQMGVQWNWENTNPNDMIIDASHKGPCIIYLSGDGASWFKIYEFGYNTVTNMFCVTQLIADKGLLKFTLPKDIAPGNYLLRAEIIALHEANRMNGAQPYVGCAELTISGTGQKTPAGVQFPGAYSPTDPGILFNIYATPMAPYVVPGPAVYASANSPTASPDDNSGNNPTPSPNNPTPSPGTSGNNPTPSPPNSSGKNPTSSPDNNDESQDEPSESAAIAVVIIVLVALVIMVVAPAFIYKKRGEIFGYAFRNGRFVSTKDKNEPGNSNINYVAFVDNDDL